MRVVILGGGESGVGAAYLAKAKGFEVFLSDMGKIRENYKKELDKLFTKYSDALIKDFLANKTNADKSVLTNPAIFPIASRWTELLIKNINQSVYNS